MIHSTNFNRKLVRFRRCDTPAKAGHTTYQGSSHPSLHTVTIIAYDLRIMTIVLYKCGNILNLNKKCYHKNDYINNNLKEKLLNERGMNNGI